MNTHNNSNLTNVKLEKESKYKLADLQELATKLKITY